MPPFQSRIYDGPPKHRAVHLVLVKHTLRQVPPLAWEGGPRLKNALSGGNLGVTEASILRISAYTDRCKDRR